MDWAELPIKICERIIDSCSTYPPSFYPKHHADLRACALTCQDWLPRSRRNLYRNVRLGNTRQINAFLDTIATQPSLAALVRELVVGCAKPIPDDRSKTSIPFAQDALVSALRGVRTLRVFHFPWQAQHPCYFLLAARYPVVQLTLVGGTYQTMAELFRVIWAFEHLQTLTLAITEPFKRPDIRVIRPNNRICPNLRTVTILEPELLRTNTFPPRGWFGQSLTQLSLLWTKEFVEPSDALLLYLSASSALRHITWRADCRGRWSHNVLADCTRYVSYALHGIPADGSLRWVSLDYKAQAAMGIQRTSLIDYALNQRLGEALKRFVHFEGLTLSVPEPKRESFGVAWWTDQIARRRREYRALVAVDVRPAPASTVWAEESDWAEAESGAEEEGEFEYYWENGQMRVLSRYFKHYLRQ